eukprot:7229106-Pyramimonas_sp.AAC.1
MGAVKALVAEWAAYWRTSAPPPDLRWPRDLGARPERPTVEQLRRVFATFRVGGGKSFDNFSPRDFGVLGDGGVDALAGLIVLIEERTTWPEFVNKFAFVPKRE